MQFYYADHVDEFFMLYPVYNHVDYYLLAKERHVTRVHPPNSGSVSQTVQYFG